MTSLLSRLNPTPSFPPYTGAYQVGTTDVEVPVSSIPSGIERPSKDITTIAFRIFYPCAATAPPSQTPPKKHRNKNVYWISSPQRPILSAYARFLGANPTVASIFASLPNPIYHVSIPAQRDAPLADPGPQAYKTTTTTSNSHSKNNSTTKESTPPQAPQQENHRRWPTLIFSHGLGGSRNAYSHLCGSLASHGMIVIAPDHRDGSQPIAFMRKTPSSPAGGSVDYKRASHAACPETFAVRDEQLRCRLWEISAVLEALGMVDRGEVVGELHAEPITEEGANVLRSFHGSMDIHRPGSVAFAGHSFGAATVVQLLKSAFYADQVESNPLMSYCNENEKKPAVLSQITASTPTILLDPWALPLDSPNTADLASKPLPAFTSHDSTQRTQPASTTTTTTQETNDKEDDDDNESSPVLAVLSSAFYNWTSNLNSVLHLLSPPPSTPTNHPQIPKPHIFYPHPSAHLSQSDFGILFPSLTKRFAKADEPVRTLGLNVRAVLEVLRRRGGGGCWAAVGCGGGVGGVNVNIDGDGEGEGDGLALGDHRGRKKREEEVEEEEDEGFVLVDDDGGHLSSNKPKSKSKPESKPGKEKEKEKREGDWRILSRVPGTVRGWIPVPLNDDDDDGGGSSSSSSSSSSTTASAATKTITNSKKNKNKNEGKAGIKSEEKEKEEVEVENARAEIPSLATETTLGVGGGDGKKMR